MSATTLHLKMRSNSDRASITRQFMESLHGQPLNVAQAALWNAASMTLGEATVHDKVWLTMIVNWSPREPGGLPVTEQARWFNLALRVDRLDDNRTGKFTLSATQAEMIFKRLCDKQFIVTNNNPAWVAFSSAFFDAYGQWPDGVKTEDKFDAEFEPDP